MGLVRYLADAKRLDQNPMNWVGPTVLNRKEIQMNITLTSEQRRVVLAALSLYEIKWERKAERSPDSHDGILAQDRADTANALQVYFYNHKNS